MKGFDPNDSSGFNRRDVLKQFSALGGIGGILGMAGTASAAAPEALPDVEWLRGREARSVVDRLTATGAFERLADRVRSEANHLVVAPRPEHVARSSHDGQTVEMAYFEVVGTGFDEGYVTIGADADTGEVTTAGLEYTRTEQVAPVPSIANAAATDGNQIRAEVHAVDATDGMAEQTITQDTTALAESPGQYLDAQVGILSHGPYCELCQFAVGLLCEYGCGLPGWFLCGLLGLGTAAFGGLGCLAFVAAACAVIATIGCGVTHVAERVCKHPDVDMC